MLYVNFNNLEIDVSLNEIFFVPSSREDFVCPKTKYHFVLTVTWQTPEGLGHEVANKVW